MIEGLEKRIVLYCDSVISLYLAYLIKIKNPDIYVAIVNNENDSPEYFLACLDSLKKTKLGSLIDFNSIIKNKYSFLEINNINNKKININLKNTCLFDYQKLKKYLTSSCISQNVDFYLNFDLDSLNENTVILKNKKTNEVKELSYYLMIFSKEVIENMFLKDINFKIDEYLSLIVDTKTNKKKIKMNILDSKNKTIVYENPINEYTKQVIVSSKNKNKEDIFNDFYKDEDYKIISKDDISKKYVCDYNKYMKNVFFIGQAAGIYNHLNITDLYLPLLNAEVVERIITEKIKNKKDIKDYEKNITSLIKNTDLSIKTIDFIFSKTSAELDSIFIKLDHSNVFKNINVSDFKKEINRLKLNPKYLLILKDFLFR